MNDRRALFVQAIRGPILLITLGVLFAIQQAGFISLYRTWPLIIIMIGILKLIERMAVQHPSTTPVRGPQP